MSVGRRARGTFGRLPAVLAAAAAAACRSGGVQSALDPDGPGAAGIYSLWWWLFWWTAIPATITVVLLLLAVRRARRADAPAAAPAGRDNMLIVVGGVIVPAVILTILVTASVLISSDVARPPHEPDLVVEVTAHQFWWEIRYRDEDVVTANELHLPAGQPTRIELTSADVIHSFWVPRLHGKMDNVPGRVNTIWLQPDRPGVFRGQCAEFCGIQHALMAFLVVAEPPDAFTAWLERRRQPAPEPVDPLTRRGREVFQEAGCHLCHTVRDTFRPGATGSVGPDLTHVSSRRTIGAAALPNTPAHLRQFVQNPHARKPGVRMPATGLAGDDLEALLAFLSMLR